MSDDQKDAGIDLLLKEVETKGVAISSVKDGHLIIFDRKWMQAKLDEHPDQKRFIIFLQQPQFNN
jgi:hypothetical protein